MTVTPKRNMCDRLGPGDRDASQTAAEEGVQAGVDLGHRDSLQSEGLVNLFYRGPEKWRFKSKHANIATNPCSCSSYIGCCLVVAL